MIVSRSSATIVPDSIRSSCKPKQSPRGPTPDSSSHSRFAIQNTVAAPLQGGLYHFLLFSSRGCRHADEVFGNDRISTGFVESAVNEIVAKRMVRKQQMRWNRRTVQSFLDVRIHVLNGTLENAFRQWHQGFRPIADRSQVAVAA